MSTTLLFLFFLSLKRQWRMCNPVISDRGPTSDQASYYGRASTSPGAYLCRAYVRGPHRRSQQSICRDRPDQEADFSNTYIYI